MQPVSSSPPPVPDSRQNGLVDPCHRKRVSLTRNLDPGGRESDTIESGKRIVYSRLIRVTSNERINRDKNFRRVNNRAVPSVNNIS